jgi:hypothetical protein
MLETRDCSEEWPRDQHTDSLLAGLGWDLTLLSEGLPGGLLLEWSTEHSLIRNEAFVYTI